MRTIKFRGKRKDNSEWVYGYYFITPLTDEATDSKPEDGWVFLTGRQRHCISKDGCVYEVIPETVGQFTGLKDKNGVEIYEHDKLKWTYESHHLRGGKVEDIIEVKWVNSGWHLGINEAYEVIGNIHERSEK